MPFYTFDQNDSGGYFKGHHYVIIEAESADAQIEAKVPVDA